ncbi:MAG: GDSL family lipase [Variovorax sp.]|nr:MAG: GDSL family lipase [Variovorax sp.]
MKALGPVARLALASFALLAALASQAQSATATDAAPSPAYVAAQKRWHGELAAFAQADRERMPGEDGVLFVGSSTIRFWRSLAQDFPQLPVVINRGFGGSTMADCSLFARELVVRYKPRQVLVYAGDNDLAGGQTPLQVLESFARFANAVRAELPNARISFISIKPSPSREKLLPQIREANDIIGAYLNRLPNSEYIDVFTPMLGADGRPRADLFRGDMLHLNDDGYRMWRGVVAGHLAAGADQRDAARHHSGHVAP